MKKLKRAIYTFILTFIVTFLISLRIYGQDLTDTFNAGVNQYKIGNYTECLNTMDKILSLSPQNYNALYYKAISHVRLKQYDEAKNYYYEIITNSTDNQLVEYAKNGVKLLDPKNYEKSDSNDMSSSNVIIKETTVNQVTNKPVKTVEAVNNNEINKLAKEKNISPKELNDLIILLSKNPSLLNTLNKLANNNSGTANSNNLDPKAIAQMIKMMTLNSEMGLLSQNNDNNYNNNNSMDLLGLMNGTNNNNKQQMLMQYLNQNKGKINPDMINSMMNQNMFPF